MAATAAHDETPPGTDPSMFRKLLIANRGEVACRIIRTARAMGLPTVAVYSDADRDSLAVAQADEAVAIGPAAARDSYLAIDNILAALRDSGADAVHPGFGFLSENAAFATTVAAAGATFIGPPPAAIAAMGDKLEAKRIAAAVGVSILPGHAEAIDSAAAAGHAAAIGYPVMLKAAAGGGGKGMRVAHDAAALGTGFESARNEARASFADERVFLEKYIDEPRHIEIQVVADAHGNVVHLGERECSIQRRHQKVIEEAPSPFLDAATRAAMGAQAVALARAVDYRSVGTVEFIVDPDRNFYFLEMNTRLQVEHPVTELVTGHDLVALMIRIAAGEKLPFAQSEVRLDGWAIEARIYAEDPSRGFLPSIGRLTRYRTPPQDAGVRVDTGVDEGDEVTVHYDPMLAKLITHGADRPAAIAAMRSALDSFQLRGIRHNIGFLATIVGLPRFADGRLSTHFIADAFPDGYVAPAPDGATRARLIAVAALVHGRDAARGIAPEGVAQWVVRLGDATATVQLTLRPDGATVNGATVNGATVNGATENADGASLDIVSDWRPGMALFRGAVDGVPLTVQIDRHGSVYRLHHHGIELDAMVMRPHVAALMARMPAKAPPDRSRLLLSPMPGLLVAVLVAAGQVVKAGEELAVVEAMKMENVLRATRDGTVQTVHVAPGDSLTVDQAILEFH